jgi:hypothetical protein
MPANQFVYVTIHDFGCLSELDARAQPFAP